jgi:UDP-hydrolysing UDP-N-acetyl-D-glucosamine 2-epimerase
MRLIGATTFARSDYSSLLPVLEAIRADPDLTLHLYVSGTHLSGEFGHTVDEILQDGFPIQEQIQMPLGPDSPEGTACSLGTLTLGFARGFARQRPDILLLVGDRYEILSAACAALPFQLPVAHISGGDITEGAIDDQVRYAVTQLSHVHFVSLKEHADRLVGLGEEPWRVHVTGDPALDLVGRMAFLSRAELSASLGVDLKAPVLVVTYHPTTLASLGAAQEIEAVLGALEGMPGTLLFTYPNADAGHRAIIEKIEAFAAARPGARALPSLGQRRYYSLLAQADLLLGNSSSGLWEAPSFELPSVNVGERQRGRHSAPSVLHAPAEKEAILKAVRTGLSPGFRNSLRGLKNPYGDGQAAPRIVRVLKDLRGGPELLQKRRSWTGSPSGSSHP